MRRRAIQTHRTSRGEAELEVGRRPRLGISVHSGCVSRPRNNSATLGGGAQGHDARQSLIARLLGYCFRICVSANLLLWTSTKGFGTRWCDALLRTELCEKQIGSTAVSGG